MYTTNESFLATYLFGLTTEYAYSLLAIVSCWNSVALTAS